MSFSHIWKRCFRTKVFWVVRWNTCETGIIHNRDIVANKYTIVTKWLGTYHRMNVHFNQMLRYISNFHSLPCFNSGIAFAFRLRLGCGTFDLVKSATACVAFHFIIKHGKSMAWQIKVALSVYFAIIILCRLLIICHTDKWVSYRSDVTNLDDRIAIAWLTPLDVNFVCIWYYLINTK